MNNEMRKYLEGFGHGVMEITSQNLSVGSVKYLNHDVKCPDWDSSGSPSGLFPVNSKEVILGKLRATSSFSLFVATGNRLLDSEQVVSGENTVGEP